MAITLCDSLLKNDIQGYNCDKPMVKGAEAQGVLLNKSDIASYEYTTGTHMLVALALKSGARGYKIVQGGKTPFSGTQQELVEGTYQNTLNNTVQFAILNSGNTTADIVDALMNGEFVGIVPNRHSLSPNEKYQVYGLEGGLHASAMVRELYNDDTLAGWLVTMLEEGATKSAIYLPETVYNTLTEESALSDQSTDTAETVETP